MKHNVLSRFTHVFRGEYVRNVLTLMGGTLLGQGLVFLLSPFVTRLFSPQDFTTLEQYTMLVAVLTPLVTGKYEFAIMSHREKNDALHVVGLSLKVASYTCLFLMFFMLFLAKDVSYWLSNEAIGVFLWTLPIVLFFTAVFNIFNYWFSRLKQYKIALSIQT